MTDPRIEAAALSLLHTDNYDMPGFSSEQFGAALVSEHHGDCTKISCSCIRCICEEALSEVSSILAAADAAAWIKMSDQLPDDGQEVLIWTCDGIIINDGFHLNDEGGYFDCADNEDVTHWQPLPAPPASSAELGGVDG